MALGYSTVEAAAGWVDGAMRCLRAEPATVSAAHGRVISEEIRAPRPIPSRNRAALDGFAVQADATIGASSYNPLPLPALAVAAGDAVPPGTDAVIPLELSQPEAGGYIQCVEPVAPGDNVEAEGAVATAGAMLATAGTRLAARHIGLLTSAGFSAIRVIRRPRVRIVIPKPDATEDSNGQMIRAAAERDGGVVEAVLSIERNRPAIKCTLGDNNADIILVVGGTGRGSNDCTAAALAEAGELAIHGVALRPGETAGLGRAGSGVPVVLLPGWPRCRSLSP
jgi:molybdopterin molybdotransferase